MAQKQIKTSDAKPAYKVPHTIVNIYLVIMFSFFPLFLRDGTYSHARMDKYWFYLISVAVIIIPLGIYSVISGAAARASADKIPSVKSKPFSTTDIFMLCFVGLAAISAILSSYPAEAFFGPGFPDPLHLFDSSQKVYGRNNSLLLLLAYALVYFVITRNYIRKIYVFVVYLAASSLIALLTVLNYFYIDPINIFEGYDESTIVDFGSTLGNKNIIAAFMCIFLPVAVMLFVVTEIKLVRVTAGVAIVFAYTGVLCADSTSDILGMLVIVPVMAIFSARSYTYLKRYLLAMTIMFGSGKLLMLFSTVMRDHHKGFEFIQDFLIYHPLSYVLFLLCGVAYCAMLLCGEKLEPRYKPKAVQIVFSSLFAVSVITFIGLFINFSFIDKETDIGNLEKLLRFDDYWGTHRGFMWRVSFEEFSKFDLKHILFGTGPDTAYYVLKPHFAELAERFGDGSTDCAHNEFINYLLTQGVLGLTAYLGLMVTAFVRAVKTAKNDPMALVFICPVICYLAQSTVNLYNPIITPTMFLFLTLAEATSRNTERQLRLKAQPA